MSAGALVHIITVERREDSVNEYGTATPAWLPRTRLRAELIERTTEEFLTGAGATDTAAVVFRTHVVDGIRTGDRVLFDGETFPIREVVRLGRRHRLELRCVRTGADE